MFKESCDTCFMGKAHVTLEGEGRDVDVILCRDNPVNRLAALTGEHLPVAVMLRFGEGEDDVKEVATGDLIDSGNAHVIDVINAKLDEMAKGAPIQAIEVGLEEGNPLAQIIKMVDGALTGQRPTVH